MTTKNITVEMRGDSRGVTRAARGAVSAVKRVSDSARRAARQVGAIGGGLALLGGGAIVALGAQAAESVDKVAKLGTQLGVASSEVQKLQLQAELSGIAPDKLIKGFQTLTRVGGDALRGSKSAVAAFEEIGISVREIESLAPDELFNRVTDALGKMEDPARQASVGSILLGRAFERLVPMLKDGGASAATASRIFDELDLGLGDTAKNVEGLNDAWTVMVTIGAALRDQVFSALAPQLEAAAEGMGQVLEGWIKANGGGKALAATLAGELVSSFVTVVGWVESAVEVVNAFLDVLDLAVQGIRFLGQLGGAIGAAAVAVADGNFSEAGTILGTDLADVWDAANPATETDPQAELQEQTSVLRDLLRVVQASDGVAFQ